MGRIAGGSNAKRGLAMLQAVYGGMQRDLARRSSGLLAVVATDFTSGELDATVGSQ